MINDVDSDDNPIHFLPTGQRVTESQQDFKRPIEYRLLQSESDTDSIKLINQQPIQISRYQPPRDLNFGVVL